MKRLLGILGAGIFLALAFIGSASAQQVNLYCWVDNGPPIHWAPCSATNQLQVSGGGGGGLSVTDQAAFTAGASSFTPGGGFYNSSQQTLTSGTQGTFALSSVRSLEVDTPTTNSNLNTILTAPQPYLPATTPTTNTYTTGVTSPANGDLHGAWYSDISAWAGTQLGAPSNYGTSPGTVPVPGVNAFITNTPAVTVSAGSAAIGAVFGPTAVGSANANPPVVIGGTATGAAGANVQGLSIVATSTAPVTATNTAVVVDLRPDSPGIITLGQTTKSGSAPVTIASDQGPIQTTTATTGGTLPNAATAIQGNATGSTGAVVGTLAAAAAKTTYLCDFDVSALGTASSVGPIVIAGLLGGSKTYQMGTLATGTQQLLSKNFNPCLPGSAVNTAITITTTADASASAVDVNSSGYQQ
jgi:hypothetical protein